MKRFLPVVLALLAAPAAATELTLLSHPLAPFTEGTPSQPTGLAVELVQELLRRTKDSGMVVIEPYTRLMRDVQSGPMTVGFIVARTPARERLMQWVGPLVTTPVHLFKKAGAPITLKTLEDVRAHARIGVTRGGSDHQNLLALGFQNFDFGESQDQDLHKVLLGRTDATPMGEIVFKSTLAQAGLSPAAFERVPVKLYDSAVYLALSPDIPVALVSRWSAALVDLKRSGAYASLLARYGVAEEDAGGDKTPTN